MSAAELKILILGGYGTFGGRLAQLLSDEPRLTLVIAGRSLKKAKAFCKQLPSAAKLVPLEFDRKGDLELQLKEIQPNIAVDASGPFQDYGDNPYRVVKACIALGIHYLDLADGSAFVKNIRQFDAEAKAASLFVLSGVSSFPVLTAAVARKLALSLKHIHTVTGGIAPSPYAGVGLNVIRAIAGYAGRPVTLVRDGAPSTGYALTETMRYTVCPPGMLPLNNLRYSLVDVPDLQVIPEEWPGLGSIWMGAAPVPEILQRMLNVLAWLVRIGLVPSLLPLASLFYRAINILRWGEHRGGMFVEVEGMNGEGKVEKRSWHLLAEGDDGPLIPSMAIEAIMRHMLAGKTLEPGARSAAGALELADYDTLFQRRTIYTGFRGMTPMPETAPLYQRVLEDAWQQLPAPLRALHNLKNTLTAEGAASAERGKSLPARWVAALIGFPEAGEQVPVKVSFQLQDGREIWRRNFAGKSFLSIQSQGKGRAQGLLCERFGPFSFGIALVLKEGKLRLVVRSWSVLGLPLPRLLVPGGDTYEYAEDGRFRFHVEITHPLAGLIVRYQGWLQVTSQDDSESFNRSVRIT